MAFEGTAGFLKEVEDVSGLLFAVDPDRTRFRFLHRSLQELLAARARSWRSAKARGSSERSR